MRYNTIPSKRSLPTRTELKARVYPTDPLKAVRSSAILLAFIVLPCLGVSNAAQESLDERLQRKFNEIVRPLLKTHCGDATWVERTRRGVNLEDYVSIDKIREHDSSWEQVRGVIRADAMRHRGFQAGDGGSRTLSKLDRFSVARDRL